MRVVFDVDGKLMKVAFGFVCKNGVEVFDFDNSGEKLCYVKEVKGNLVK